MKALSTNSYNVLKAYQFVEVNFTHSRYLFNQASTTTRATCSATVMSNRRTNLYPTYLLTRESMGHIPLWPPRTYQLDIGGERAGLSR